ncbi:hypothetical protein B0T21DRAFT_280526 [Apiosordaria backusii]|uniref:Uncharacterized protein n=1 Tax=Apiosordaria backusii TaxID=314023 RepID=A0AA40ES65_9PEZI|nr:hypothetical protein B0T21DRAFT_280526 [Apiosordaria backusii]
METEPSPQATLLLLPGELRNHIYREYLCAGTEDGYVYDFEAGKLRTADHQPIELNLMYTCKRIAQEMRGLALSIHTVTFSTLYSRTLRTRAARWAYFVSRFRGGIGWHAVRQAVPPEVIRQVVGERSLVHAISCLHDRDAPEHEDFENFGPRPFDWEKRGGLAAYLAIIKEPWRIPTEDELDTIGACLPTPAHRAPAALRDMWQDHPGKFRFSAAAAAIHFLSSLPANTRKYMRRICLREDRVSVAHPECHIRGLVPYCLENPALRIERRASLWTNLFQACAWGSAGGQFKDPFDWPFGLIDWMGHWGGPFGDVDEDLPADHATRPVALWMAEASHPDIPDSVSLVLDGDPTRERSADVFREAVQRDAAWQTAMERRFIDMPTVLFNMREITAEHGWHVVRFPQLLLDINKPSSRIQCNFDPGQPWDDDQIAEIISTNKIAEDALVPNLDDNGQPYPVYPEAAWESERSDLFFATVSPLPPFRDLLDDNMDPGYIELDWVPPWDRLRARGADV